MIQHPGSLVSAKNRKMTWQLPARVGMRIHLTNINWEFTRFQVLGLEPGLRGEEVSEMSKTCTLFTRNAVGCRRQAHYAWVLVGSGKRVLGSLNPGTMSWAVRIRFSCFKVGMIRLSSGGHLKE